MKNYLNRTKVLSVTAALLLGMMGCSSDSTSEKTPAEEAQVVQDTPVQDGVDTPAVEESESDSETKFTGGSTGGTATPGISTPVAKAVSFNGTAIDGILVGSTVCIDTNKDGVCADELFNDQNLTDDKGKFQITSTSVGPLVLLGGMDSGTGEAFTGALSAPAGSSVVTPLTSAVQALVERGQSAADAEASVKLALGLPDVELTNFDPFEEIGDAENAADAKAILAKQTQLQILVHTAAVTVAGANDDTDVNSTMANVFDSIVGDFADATGEIELTADRLAEVTKEVAEEVYADDAAARVAAKIVADAAAANAVRDANAAAKTIAEGDPADLNDAITKVNTTTEDAVKQAAKTAAEAAKAVELALPGALEEIERLQGEREEAEAAIAAAAKAAQDAADALAVAEAQKEADLESYKAYLAAKVAAEAAAAEQAAAEQAAAEAAAAAAAAEKAIDAAKAAEEAAALAAAEQAAAEAAEAAARQAAAQAEAEAAKDAADLAAAKAAAAAAAALEVKNLAVAKVKTYAKTAYGFAVQAENDAMDTEALEALFPSIDASAARSAANMALIKADDTNGSVAIILAFDVSQTVEIENAVSDANVTKAAAFAQALIAQAELETARVTKAQLELAIAQAAALAAKEARIDLLVTTVTHIDGNMTAALAATDPTMIKNDLDEIGAILAGYPMTQAKADLAVIAGDDANASLTIAIQNASVVKGVITVIVDARDKVNETAALTQEAIALEQSEIFEINMEIVGAKTLEVRSLLGEIQQLKLDEDNRLQGVIGEKQALVNAYIDDANASLILANGAIIASSNLFNVLEDAERNNPDLDFSGYFQAWEPIDVNVTGLYGAAATEFASLETISLGATEQEAIDAEVAALALKDAIVAKSTLAVTAGLRFEAILSQVEAFILLEASSSNVQDSINTLSAFVAGGAADNSFAETLESIKGTLDPANKDESILLAMIDVIEVFNSDAVTNLVEFKREDGTPINNSNLNILTQELDNDIVIAMAATASTAGGVDVLHTMATKLKTANDVLANAFEDSEKVFVYATENDEIRVNYDDASAIRVVALSMASTLDTIASYSYGSIELFRVKEREIDGEVYEYIQADIDELSMFQQSTFFKMNNAARLVNSGVYLKSAVTLASDINVTALSVAEFDETDIDEVKKIRDAFNGDGIVKNEETNESVNLLKVFSSTDYLDRNDFEIPTTYMGESAEVVAEYAKKVAYSEAMFLYEQARCDANVDDLPEPNSPDINYGLAYANLLDTPVTLDLDLSIKGSAPVYAPGARYDYSGSGSSDGSCSVSRSFREYRFEAEFDIKLKDSFREVVEVDPDFGFTTALIENKTFYIAGMPYDGDRYEAQVTFNANGTRSYSKNGIQLADAEYEIVDGDIHISNSEGLSVTLRLEDIDETGALRVEVINRYGHETAELIYFSTQAQLDNYMSQFFNSSARALVNETTESVMTSTGVFEINEWWNQDGFEKVNMTRTTVVGGYSRWSEYNATSDSFNAPDLYSNKEMLLENGAWVLYDNDKATFNEDGSMSVESVWNPRTISLSAYDAEGIRLNSDLPTWIPNREELSDDVLFSVGAKIYVTSNIQTHRDFVDRYSLWYHDMQWNHDAQQEERVDYNTNNERYWDENGEGNFTSVTQFISKNSDEEGARNIWIWDDNTGMNYYGLFADGNSVSLYYEQNNTISGFTGSYEIRDVSGIEILVIVPPVEFQRDEEWGYHHDIYSLEAGLLRRGHLQHNNWAQDIEEIHSYESIIYNEVAVRDIYNTIEDPTVEPRSVARSASRVKKISTQNLYKQQALKGRMMSLRARRGF